jgi:hypothetical protein
MRAFMNVAQEDGYGGTKWEQESIWFFVFYISFDTIKSSKKPSAFP